VGERSICESKFYLVLEVRNAPGIELASIYLLKHVHDILLTYKTHNKSWTSCKSLKDVLSNVVVPEIKSICQSLLNYNSKPNAHIERVFKHEQVVDMHLNLIKLALKEGNLYLKLVRAEELRDGRDAPTAMLCSASRSSTSGSSSACST
jgi:hypothetical protein